MSPVLLQIGPLNIRWYSLMYLLGFGFALLIASHEIKRLQLGWNMEKFLDLMLYSFMLAIIGARLYYVAFEWPFYMAHPADIVAVWKGGLAIHGGIIGAVAGVLFFSRRYGFDALIVGDICVLGAILGQTFGRFGNFMNGDAHGLPTSLPWGIVFPEGTAAGNQFPGVPLHPVMLYEMILNALIFFVLWKVRKLSVGKGFLTALYVGLYGVGRFLVSFLRADSLMLGPLRAAHLISLLMITGALFAIFRFRLWNAREHQTSRAG